MTRKQHKILIMKVGYSETLDAEIGSITSYGDVLRTTVLLNLYKDDHVTWLVDEKALPILKGNPHIDRILIYNLTSVLQLQAEQFDTIINLEKVPGLCALADSISAWRRHGFRFDVRTGEAEAYDGTHGVLDICRNIESKRHRKVCWQEGLFEMVGAQWKGEEYVFGPRPLSKEKYDIGFNHLVGNKWPLKGWPIDNWKRLEKLIGTSHSVSWQQGQDDMEKYFDWINSCRVIVTNDSFGMHIAMALKKKFIAVFGPTHCEENHLYGLGVAFAPKGLDCDLFPCREDQCRHFKSGCTTTTTPEMVWNALKGLLTTSSGSKNKRRGRG
jgi:heptosyltransferase-2